MRTFLPGTVIHSSISTVLLLLLSATIASAQPGNNTCASASAITPGASCAGSARLTGQTLKNATATAGIPSCGPGNTGSADVWYSFVATSSYPTIALSNIGGDLRNTSRGNGTMIQLLSGTCGSLTSLSCVTSTTATTNTLDVAHTIGGAGLTVGNTYYVRIATNNNSTNTSSGSGWGFTICITDPIAPRHGNSYVNLTKKTVGGVVEPGDTLEIRMTIHHTNDTLYKPRYVDNIPSNTQIVESPDANIRVITNEGLTYYSFTTQDLDDAATYKASPGAGEYNIRLNLGFAGSTTSAPADNSETSSTGTGRMLSGNNPRGGSGLLFATSFIVVVTGNVGDTITLGSGKFLYAYSPTASDRSLSTTPYKILISEPQSLCTNATGVNYAQETGGTFGGGTDLNRSYDLDFPIPGYTRITTSSSQGTGDGQYSIVKNLSPRSGTIRTADRTPDCPTALPSEQSCQFRMHGGHWDIDGDHTGTNDAIGNIPPGLTDSSGYMLMVNADYVASETFRQTINDLCPNTYYEFSAWFRNICPTCGIDSVGTSYLPRQPGVLPNLTFSLDNLDRYSTGEMQVEGWVKKGFVFRTGPSQTTATFAIRNNAQGGGGNDWAMDDISIATCLPNMSYSPSLNPNVCEGNALTIYDTVRSYFGNYTHYLWQRSTDNGVSWSDVGITGNASTVVNGNGEYEYVTSYTIPSTETTVSDSGDRYRVIVATTADNLSSSSCQVTDGISIISLAVLDCGEVLSTSILQFNARLVNGKARLQWLASREEGPVQYIVEKSLNGIQFEKIGTVDGYNNGAASNSYDFTENSQLQSGAWYRITMNAPDRKRKISQIIQLSPAQQEFDLMNVINPFGQSLRFDLTLARNNTITIELFDNSGRLVRKEKQLAYAGVNSLQLLETDRLQAGVYTLRVSTNEGQFKTRRVIHQ